MSAGLKTADLCAKGDSNDEDFRRQGCPRHGWFARHWRSHGKCPADQGADVAISYVGAAEKAKSVVDELKSKGVRAAAFKADQGDPAQAES